MSDASFVHLHVHTQYSLLQGAIRIADLTAKAKSLGMPAVAITDTGGLFGVMELYFEAKKAGIKPIIGCVMPVKCRMEENPNGLKTNPLVFLCKNDTGYRNLCELITKAYLSVPPGEKAVLENEWIFQKKEGLIVLSAGLKSEISALLLTQQEDRAEKKILEFKKHLGEDFYLELIDNQIPEQQQLNEALYELGKRLGVACVATSECHYLDPEDAEAHEVLQCIEVGKNLDFERPQSLVPSEYYFKDARLMRERFEAFPGVCEETLKIADKCNLNFKLKHESGKPIYHLPHFRPEGMSETEEFDADQYLRDQAKSGLEARFKSPVFAKLIQSPDWGERKKRYQAQLETELEMIISMGFGGYYLIVADFIGWSKAQGIPVGPGRGSGAGSLVSYALLITDIDPIRYGLFFERFLNPERVSMPDFDIDFCQDRRSEVLHYVARRYGEDRVAQIITFGALQPKAVIKDVGRVLGFSFNETNSLTKLIPNEPTITLGKALEREPMLRERIEREPRVAKIFNYSRKLEGLYRNAGIHAAGVIITEKPMSYYCPLFVGKEGERVIQFDKGFAEKVGLVKFDFLGLKTLTVIDQAVKLINDPNFSLEKIDLADPKVYALISSGNTDGVFQVEGGGMKGLCMRIQPSCLEDLSAINALYRPGPLGSGMLDDYIERKHSKKEIVYDDPRLESCLKETYGVMTYQEQVMQVARELAGYSLGQADILRRAMGKKDEKEMSEQRAVFVQGAAQRGLTQEKANSIFNLMAKFAEYGFNKSHSMAYSMITYQTAYLKTHYSAEFMAALLTTEMSDTEKIAQYINNCRSSGLEILPPDINRSQKRFSVEVTPQGKAIRFGMEAIKGVGSIAVDGILEERAQGPFKNTLDFIRRVPTRKVNKKVLEALTLAGALDPISEINRASLFASVEKLLEFAGGEQEEKELGQTSLFDSFSAEEVKLTLSSNQVFKQEEEWPPAKKLALEKQTVGFYVSGHPMDGWQKICEDWLNTSVDRMKRKFEETTRTPPPEKTEEYWRNRPPRVEYRLAGVMVDLEERTSKKTGKRMATARIEDHHGSLEVLFFNEAFMEIQDRLRESCAVAEPVVLTCELKMDEEMPKLIGRKLEWVKDAHRSRVQKVVIRIDAARVSTEQLRELKGHLIRSRGKCPVRLAFIGEKFRTHLDLGPSIRVSASPELVQAVSKLLGINSLSLQ